MATQWEDEGRGNKGGSSKRGDKKDLLAGVSASSSHNIRRRASHATDGKDKPAAAQTFNNVEEIEEEHATEMAHLCRQVEDYLIKKHPEVHKKRQAAEKNRRTASGKADGDKNSDGESFCQLSYPYTVDQARVLMHEFCKEKPPKVSRSKLEELLMRFERAYAEKVPEGLAKIQVPKDGKLIVVGDTHGQLNDLLWIFVSQGIPNNKTFYVFNGDIADRGDNAIEIFIIVFVLFFVYPSSILINRGNHEDVFMNQLPKNGGGGFFDEVLDRYDYGIYDLFVQIFKRLPLATVINDEVFVVHGGLPRLNTFSLEYIKNLPWTTCTTPSTDNGDMRSHVFLDMLWSDPVETMGKFPSRRGAGIQFGLDVTASFLRANKLKMVIRSHQCPVDNHGYYVHHQGLCLTVFSASNYCGEVGNWGATIAFSGET